MATLRLLTYNVLFGKRIDKIIDWINRLPDYDVLCLQEFPKQKIAESMRVLSRRPYGYSFAQSMTYRNKIYGLLTIYRKDRLTLQSSKIVSLGINKLERRVLRTSVPRSCLITNFKIGVHECRIVNIHIVAMAVNAVKYSQVNTIVRSFRSVRPTILLGDFNISSVVGRRKLMGVMESLGFSGVLHRMRTHRVGLFSHQFDYVFTKAATITEAWPVKIKLSDHYPVHVRCAIPARASGHSMDDKRSSRRSVAKQTFVSQAP